VSWRRRRKHSRKTRRAKDELYNSELYFIKAVENKMLFFKKWIKQAFQEYKIWKK
jgi:hypothetical protein